MSCPKCVEGYVLPGEPGGQMEPDFQGAYHATYYASDNAAEAQSASSTRTIVFLTDGFGLPLKNCKIMADNLARRLECDVWVPDYLDGVYIHYPRSLFSWVAVISVAWI